MLPVALRGAHWKRFAKRLLLSPWMMLILDPATGSTNITAIRKSRTMIVLMPLER
jgi:hypothetical protein